MPTWTHILEHLFQFTSIKNIDINFDFLPQDLKITELNSHEERIRYVSKLKPFLKTLPHQKRQFTKTKSRRALRWLAYCYALYAWHNGQRK